MRRTIALFGALVVCVAAIVSAQRVSASFATVDLDLLDLGFTVTEPVGLAVRPASTGDDDLYIIEKPGRVQRWNAGAPTPILDITALTSDNGERGLLGIVFTTTHMYANYTDNAGDTIVVAYPWTGTGTIDPNTGKVIIKVGQPFANHNGGHLAFGPDGFLYIGLGDGGSSNDPGNRAQNKHTLLGKMLRIAPNPAGGYTVPASNPYVGRRGRDEIWAKGLRNPWRYSFDGATGDLWIGDVGQSRREEIDRQPAGKRGLNYGWRRMEGTLTNIGKRLRNKRHAKPVYQYGHDPECSVTGGYVYRGSVIADLVGAYVFGDFCTGEIRGLPINSPSQHRFLGATVDNGLSSFGQDQAGELYAMSIGDGKVYRIMDL